MEEKGLLGKVVLEYLQLLDGLEKSIPIGKWFVNFMLANSFL
jgi:hypothetical protein